MIMARTSHIHTVDDFYMNESGMILLDSVCMKLVAVGEAIKNLDKITNKELLLKYPAVNWKDIKGMRDIIVHHYFDIDASVILYSLQKEVPDLYSTICVMLRDFFLARLVVSAYRMDRDSGKSRVDGVFPLDLR